MARRNFDHATEAFEFIDKLDSLSTPQEVVDAMASSFWLFGFENFIITGLPNPKERFEQVVLLKKGRWAGSIFIQRKITSVLILS